MFAPSFVSAHATIQLSQPNADIPFLQITAFDLNGCFVCNLMNHSHIGRARLLSSRGGPYHLRLASYTRPDPGVPRMGCCCITDFPIRRVGCCPKALRFDDSQAGLEVCSTHFGHRHAPPVHGLDSRPDYTGVPYRRTVGFRASTHASILEVFAL
jgi:hypothetical protein